MKNIFLIILGLLVASFANGQSLNFTLIDTIYCNGDTAKIEVDLTVATGMPPYSYTCDNLPMNDSIKLLSDSGWHYFTAKDFNNVIVGVDSYYINYVAPLMVAINSTNNNCFGGNNGSLQAIVSGGTGVISYAWDNGVITSNNLNLPAGAYSIVITDINGCTTSGTGVITEPPPISINVNSTGCDACAIVFGGSPPFVYLWNGVNFTNNCATNLNTGIYTVSIIDINNCFSTTIFTNSGLNNQITISNVTDPCGVTTLTATSTNSSPYCTPLVNTVGPEIIMVNINNINNTSTAGASPNGFIAYPSPVSLTPGGTSLLEVFTIGSANISTWIDWNNNGLFEISEWFGGTTLGNQGNNIYSDSLFITAPANALPGPYNMRIRASALNVTNGSNNACSTFTNGETEDYLLPNITPPVFTWMPGSATGSQIIVTPNMPTGYTITATQGNCVITATTNITTTYNPISIITSSSNCTECATAFGGQPPYTYNWYGVTTAFGPCINNANGFYNVDAIDVNGCIGSAAVFINNLPFSIDATGLVSCSLSTDTIFTTNTSTNALNYSITPSAGWSGAVGSSPMAFSGLQPNTVYTITADDGTCTAVTYFGTSNNITLSASTSSNCTSSSITATAINNAYNSSFIYSISPNSATQTSAGQFNVSSLGSYTITATNTGGCATTYTINVTALPLSLNVSQSSTALCLGNTGNATFTASNGAGGYNYTLNPGNLVNTSGVFSNLNIGSYTCVVTDANNCSTLNVISFNTATLPLIGISKKDSFCTNNFGTAKASVTNAAAPPYTYSWSNGTTGDSLYTTTPGQVYTVSVTNANGCTALKTVAFLNGLFSAIANNDSVCLNVTNFISLANAAGNFSWYPTIGTLNLSGTYNTINNLTATTTFTIVSNNNVGYCKDTIYKTIIVRPNLATAPTFIITNATCPATADGAVSIIGNPSFLYPKFSYNGAPPIANPSKFGLIPNLYNVQITDATGCGTYNYTIGNNNTNCGNVTGHVTLDINNNCAINAGVDQPLQNIMVQLMPGNHIVPTDALGYYQFNGLPFNTYTATHFYNSYLTPTCNTAGSVILNAVNPNGVVNLFDSVNITNDDASLYHYPSCYVHSNNFTHNSKIYYKKNNPYSGTNALIYLKLDSVQYFTNATPAPSYSNGDTLFWNVILSPSQQFITINYFYPTSILPGYFQSSNFGYINLPFIDNYIANNSGLSFHSICAAYDPNDKQVSPPGKLANGYTNINDSILNYKIRFQNVGNAAAANVVILDTIDSKLDITSLQINGYSHPYEIEILNGNIIKFKFIGIVLPDSTTDYEGSMGFISYSIKKKPGTMVGDIIKNTAHIYFDYNPAIITNTTTNTYYQSFAAVNMTTQDNTSCSQACGNGLATVNVIGGVPPFNYAITPSCNNTQISAPLITNLPGGTYTVFVSDALGNFVDTTFTLKDPDPIILNTSTTNPTNGNNGSLTANVTSGGTAPFDYLWLPNNCNAPTCANVGGGTYTLTVVDAQGCNASVSVLLSWPTGVSYTNIEHGMLIYPNPVSDYLYLAAQQNIGAISILNQLGQEVYTNKNINSKEYTINILSLNEGIYTLRRSNGVYKFVLKR
jgi:hypothetical protein